MFILSYLIKHLQFCFDAFNIHVIDFDGSLDLPLGVDVSADVSKDIEDAFLLLSSLLKLVSLDPEETVLLGFAHVLALEHLVDLGAMMTPEGTLEALLLSFRLHLPQIVLGRRFLLVGLEILWRLFLSGLLRTTY